MSATLIGRDSELAQLGLLLGTAKRGAAGVLVLGPPGIGKTALVEASSELALSRGFTVLSCTGVRSEARLPYAGLHQLIRPIQSKSGELSAAASAALHAALCLMEGSVPEFALVGMALLELVGSVAERSPVLLIADDTHWLDARTCDVLAFASRRLDSDDVVLLATCRDEDVQGNPLAAAGLAELRLEPLGRTAATALLTRHAADLDPVVRARILSEAQGNALALIELPATARDRGLLAAGSDAMPVSARIERAFAARLPQLPPKTRTIVLVAALADQADLSEILAAATLTAGSEVSRADVEPAAAAGLLRVTGDEIVFRHPLTRSAVRQAASIAERLAAHRALAEALQSEPTRRAWHRAAAATGPDEDVALDLERLADRAEGANATDVAAAALRRAAEVGAKAERRAERWLRAAEVSWNAEQFDQVDQLLTAADTAGLDARQRARADYLKAAVRGGARLPGPDPIVALATIADDLRLAGDHERGMEALSTVAMRCYFANPEPSVRELVVRVAENMPVAADDPSLLGVLSQAAPVERGAVVLERLSALRPGANDPISEGYLGAAATAVGAYDMCGAFLESAIERLRAEGRILHLAQAVHNWAWAGFHCGNPAVAVSAAEEARRLFSETGQTLFVASAQLLQAALAGRRGEAALAETLTATAEPTMLFAGLAPMLALVCLARGVTALGDGRNAEAYEHLASIFDPQDPAYHPHLRAWALADLVEAALQSDHAAQARELCRELSVVAAQNHSPLLSVGLLISAPRLADDEAAGPFFEAALTSDLTAWPLHRARLLFAYGAWLRRRYRVAESREPLRAARDMMDACEALPWAERARQELTATGERSAPRAVGAAERLSPQELLIAQLAADGLSNREVAQRLYLSHRTVSSHLYRIFPKLGIVSRAELAAALGPRRPAVRQEASQAR